MATAFTVIFIVAILAACGALAWKLYELHEATAFGRMRYEQHVAQLRTALQASEKKLALLREVYEAPTGVAARVGAQRELATAIKTYAPHLPTRYRHTLSSLQANEKFFLSIYKAVPDFFSEAVKARLDKHKPIGNDFFDGDRSDLIAEAGILLLRAKDVLESIDASPSMDLGPKHILAEIAKGLQIGAKRSPKLAEIVSAWDMQVDADTA